MGEWKGRIEGSQGEAKKQRKRENHGGRKGLHMKDERNWFKKRKELAEEGKRKTVEAREMEINKERKIMKNGSGRS